MGIALIACQALNVWGYDFSSKTQYSVEEALDSVALYYSINPDGKTVSVTVGPEKYKFNHIRIPETVANNDVTYTVTEIAHGAFSGGNIDIVEMANTITKIGDNAFYNCGIDSIKFSKNLKSIGESAFWDSNLTSVYLPEGFEEIKSFAFAINMNKKAKLNRIILPSTLTEMGISAFAYNVATKSLIIPDKITEIKQSVFQGCSNLEILQLPKNLTTIGDYAFTGCGLLEIDENILPLKLTKIGEKAFQGAKAKSITLPDNITEIGSQAFSGCDNLQSIKFSKGLTELPNYICYSCTQLINVEIPEGIKSIDFSAFAGSSRLSKIKLPESLTSLGAGAFSSSGLTEIIIPSGINILANNVFYGCKYLKQVVIPGTIKTIGGEAFSGCSGLESIIIEDGVESIGGRAFSGCNSLTEVKLPKSIKNIESAFSDCKYLETVSMTECNLRTLGVNAFSGCSSLENITLPDSLTSIEQCAFANCTSLIDIKLKEGLTTIGIQSFYGCTSLSKIELPKSLTNIGSQAFQNCTSLGNITIPHNVSNWGKECFYGCTSLKEVHYKRAVLPSLATSVRLIEDNNQCTLFVPTGSKESYEASSNWNNFSAIVEEEIGYDILYRVSVAKTGKGTVTVNESSATNNDIVSGTDVKLLITPQNGWKIQKVTINDTDITEECLDGEYVIESIAQNTSITVIFEELPAILHLKQADGGSINIPIVKGTKFTCTLSVEDGWSINTVQFNNSNVTSQVDENNNYTSPIIYNDAILSVSYEKYGDSSVSSMIDESSVTAYVTDKGLLIIEGTENMTPISVFASDGRLVTTIISNNGRTTYNLKKRGVYLVKTISKTIKVGY